MSRLVKNPPAPGQLPRELKWLERTTTLMDTAFRIPFTNIRFGLDPILGLIPGLGEFVPTLISGVMVITMARNGVGGLVVLKMMGNILIDFLVGIVPVLGDLFDLGFKSNVRNLKLLREHYVEGKHHGSVWPSVLLATALLTGVLVIIVWGFAKLWTITWQWIATL